MAAAAGASAGIGVCLGSLLPRPANGVRSPVAKLLEALPDVKR